MNIIIFGNVPLTSWVIEQVVNCDKFNLLGVVCDDHNADDFSHHGLDYPSASNYCELHEIHRLSFEEAGKIASAKPVLGVSVRYNILFKQPFYSAFTPGIINLHGGELPRFRGTNIANHAILEGVEKGAGTMHFIDQGVDTGDVVERVYFPVTSDETAFTFFSKTLKALQQAFRIFVERIDNDGNINRIRQQVLIEQGEVAREYRHKDLIGKSEILHEEIETDLFDRKVRAFSFPKHTPAYIKVKGKKYFISLNERN